MSLNGKQILLNFHPYKFKVNFFKNIRNSIRGQQLLPRHQQQLPPCHKQQLNHHEQTAHQQQPVAYEQQLAPHHQPVTYTAHSWLPRSGWLRRLHPP